MSPLEFGILGLYFLTLVILAIFGFHRYVMVYLYFRHRDRRAVPAAPARAPAARHGPAAALQRDVRRRPPARLGLPRSTTRASCSRSRCSTTRPTRRASIAEPRRRALPRRRASTSTTSTATTAPATRPARSTPGLASGHAASSSRSSTPTSSPPPDFLEQTLVPHFADPEGRHGAGALGPHQPGLLAADADPVDPARRALRPRARRPQPRGPLLQLQRHRRASGAATAIADAGGWQHDTLTEDLDLSATARSCAAGASSSCRTWSRRPRCRSR